MKLIENIRITISWQVILNCDLSGYLNVWRVDLYYPRISIKFRSYSESLKAFISHVQIAFRNDVWILRLAFGFENNLLLFAYERPVYYCWRNELAGSLAFYNKLITSLLNSCWTNLNRKRLLSVQIFDIPFKVIETELEYLWVWPLLHSLVTYDFPLSFDHKT